jgi:LmbE family N-acetylglucosaminyl deacetylase
MLGRTALRGFERRELGGEQLMRILAVGAHPDDVEIGCGGLLAMDGIAKHILHLSNGETSKYADGERRKAEAEAAARILDARIHFFEIPGRQISADETSCLRLVGLIREIRPDLLLTHWERDGHPDHLGAHRLVRKAFYLSHAKTEVSTPPWRCRNLLYFHPFSSGFGFTPEFVLDISAVYAKKLEALRCHRSQESFIMPQVEAVSRYFGHSSGIERAEPFRAEMPLVLSLGHLISGEGH